MPKLSPPSPFRDSQVLKQLFLLLVMVAWLSVGLGCSDSQSQETLPTMTLSAINNLNQCQYYNA